MTDEERADCALADAEIAVVRAELIEIMTSSHLATLLGDDETARRMANRAQDFLLLNLDAWQICRFILRELFPEYSEKGLKLFGDVPKT